MHLLSLATDLNHCCDFDGDRGERKSGWRFPVDLRMVIVFLYRSCHLLAILDPGSPFIDVAAAVLGCSQSRITGGGGSV